MRVIVVVFVRLREVARFQAALPARQPKAWPLWTWFIDNPRAFDRSSAEA
jgi:hypothetical protein